MYHVYTVQQVVMDFFRNDLIVHHLPKTTLPLLTCYFAWFTPSTWFGMTYNIEYNIYKS